MGGGGCSVPVQRHELHRFFFQRHATQQVFHAVRHAACNVLVRRLDAHRRAATAAGGGGGGAGGERRSSSATAGTAGAGAGA